MTDSLTTQIILSNQDKDKTPHLCPVCQGKGFVRGDFYFLTPGGNNGVSANATTMERNIVAMTVQQWVAKLRSCVADFELDTDDCQDIADLLESQLADTKQALAAEREKHRLKECETCFDNYAKAIEVLTERAEKSEDETNKWINRCERAAQKLEQAESVLAAEREKWQTYDDFYWQRQYDHQADSFKKDYTCLGKVLDHEKGMRKQAEIELAALKKQRCEGYDNAIKRAEQAEAQAAVMRNCWNCGRWDKQHKFCPVDEECLGGKLWQSKLAYDAGSTFLDRLRIAKEALKEIHDWCKSANHEDGVELQYVLNKAKQALEDNQ